MAKLTLTLDTDDQSVEVDVDGQAVANISSVEVANWGSGEDPRFSFTVSTFEKVGGVHKMTRLMAKQSPEAVRAAEQGATLRPSTALPGFVEAPGMSRAQQQIADWFRTVRNSR